jgi:hypothetical protein
LVAVAAILDPKEFAKKPIETGRNIDSKIDDVFESIFAASCALAQHSDQLDSTTHNDHPRHD